MHSYKFRLGLTYVLLVGLPLLAIALTLRGGAHLQAPLAVRGDWVVSADFASWRREPCAASFVDTSQPFMTITQSGRDLTVVLTNMGNVTMVGTIDGATLKATRQLGHDKIESVWENECPGEKSLQMQAEVGGQGESRSFTGTLALKGCANCAPIAFSATRRASVGRGAS
jgi:hypothetical protein